MKLNIALAESALEVVPEEIRKHPAVKKDAERRGRDPSSILLDRSLHHAAMERLSDGFKRGRPDLIHAAVLSVTGAPLFLDSRVSLYIHTVNDLVLEIAPKTRIPKNYLRFRNLMEKHISEGMSTELIKVRREAFDQLVRRAIRPDLVVGLSIQGSMKSPESVAEQLVGARNPLLAIGGFPHGHFGDTTSRVLDDLFRIHERPLETHVVAARMVYEVEKASDSGRS